MRGKSLESFESLQMSWQLSNIRSWNKCFENISNYLHQMLGEILEYYLARNMEIYSKL